VKSKPKMGENEGINAMHLVGVELYDYT